MTTTKDGLWTPATFRTLDELHAELDAIEAAHLSGTLHTSGKWSAGQILEHCGKLMGFSFDGFGGACAPWYIRVLGSTFFKPRLGKSQMKPGIKLPASAAMLLPRDDVPFEDGMGLIRSQLARIDAGEQMTQDSPVLGKMTHEQWVLLHLDHCRMHLGFLKYD
jgi:hypothetical protein